MVNVCDQEEPIAITKSYTVETGNHISLQGDYDGKCRPVVYGNTLVNLLPNLELKITCSNDWDNYIVFAQIMETDGSITKCIRAGNKDYIYETGAVYWDDPEFEGTERP